MRDGRLVPAGAITAEATREEQRDSADLYFTFQLARASQNIKQDHPEQVTLNSAAFVNISDFSRLCDPDDETIPGFGSTPPPQASTRGSAAARLVPAPP